MSRFLRASRLTLLALSVLGIALPALGQGGPAPAPPPAASPAPKPAAPGGSPATAQAPATDPTPWLYRGSDITQDGNWRFGVLPNGLRYAVRKNGVPPGQVAVRVRIDAGSLMETDSERGYAHLLEHLSFRGSTYVPDGESKRIWQRLGVTFGSDSNASTSFTQTVYKLDLPDASAAGLDESFKILSGMMAGPNISAQSLNAERPVVLAEAREQPGPQVRWTDAMFELMFAGQPLAMRKPIGTPEALNAATPESVKAFHNRWYRPERAVVVVVGDVDQDQLEALVVKHFSAWKGHGPAPATPDFGKPLAAGPVSKGLVEPAMPPMAMMAVLRPWSIVADTVIFNQKRLVDLVAVRIINRRLESRARSGASFLAASASLDDLARSANLTSVQVLPIGGDWDKALRDVRAVIADAQATPPTQAEIDREIAEIEAGMKNRIATAPVESGVSLAELLVDAVDINETVTSAEGSYAIFKDAIDKKMFNPEAVLESTKRIFEGTASRVLVNTHVAESDTAAKAAAALSADVSSAVVRRKAVGNVTFDQLPALGAPGKVVSREVVVDQPKIEKLVFANGVNLLIHSNSAEVSKVYVNVRFGRGLSALPANRQVPAWAGEIALMPSGIGKLGQEEIDALIGQRQIGINFEIDDDAFKLSSQTTREDLADQLRLFATKLAAPAWDPSPVTRAKAGVLAGYEGMWSSPDAVLGRELDSLFRSRDPRWTRPTRAQIEALTPAAFRALWEPLLKSGPIEVEVFGDMDSEETIQAVAATFGALKPRAAGKVTPAPPFPAHVGKPVVLTHRGQPDQAAAVIAWPTGGGTAGIRESRRLDVLAAVFRDRLLDKLRSEAGVSYSPNVASDWPLGLASGGKIFAIGLLPPDKTEFFFELARGIAADLAANPISQDELDRALTPLKQTIIRSSTGNMFWMRLVEGGSLDPLVVAGVDSLAPDIAFVRPADLQALAAKYLLPEKDWTLAVLPEAKKPAVSR
ncbi:M16 family metallopeptidase [Sphingomonas canadensis]|uniref:M16 family metallopeptidase n=1 Tax=Sphingomonas canadensis TaxID=1219257 RepID=A0ABW3HC58_9SPHN|nr:insulinase family protein [Sphingomonas canadensis]MCW3838374.1 insulinase family protein [Sphingomonas canadensis]